MRVVWTEFARDKWQTIADGIFNEFGFEALQEYANETDRWQNILENNPSIGMVEPLLAGRSKEYRFVVIRKLSKMVYFIESDTLVIANIWDTRQEPIHQMSITK